MRAAKTGAFVSDAEIPARLRNVTPIPFVSRPVTLGGMGAAKNDCKPLTAAIVGGLAVLILPPLLGGFFSGLREGFEEWRDGR